jgi:hypothetical protein
MTTLTLATLINPALSPALVPFGALVVVALVCYFATRTGDDHITGRNKYGR